MIWSCILEYYYPLKDDYSGRCVFPHKLLIVPKEETDKRGTSVEYST